MIKNNSSDNPAPFPCEELIHIMVRDEEDLIEAIERFKNKDNDFSLGYRLIRLNSKFARCRRGITLFKRNDQNFQQTSLPDQMRDVLDLVEQVQESCILVEKLFSDPASSLKEIDPLFHREGELWERTEAFGKALNRFVLKWSGSGKMNEDSLTDLSNEGQDLIFQFSELHCVAYEPLSVFKNTSAFNKWKSGFTEMDKAFQSYFHCFSILNGLWNRFQLYEYFADFWWLMALPEEKESEKIEDKKVSLYAEKLVSAIGDLFRSSTISMGSCPDFEMISAFANHDDLDRETFISIKHHLHQCTRCLEDVINIRAAMKDAEHTLESPLYVSQEIWDLTIESMIKKHPERMVVPQKRTTLNSDADEFPPYIVAVEDFQDVIPLLHSTEPSFSKTIVGFVRWLKDGQEIRRAWVDVTILFEDFEDGLLTISGSLEDDFADLIPRIANWYCKWETDKNYEDIYPDSFDYDSELGQFFADFPMVERVDGRFVIWFDVLLKIN